MAKKFFEKVVRTAGMLGIALTFGFVLSSCASVSTKQYGMEDADTIALNLTKDPNVGTLFVTHINGEATGAVYSPAFMGFFGGETVYVNPFYVKLDGKPIVFTVQCPVVTGQDSQGRPTVQYKKTELRLSQLSDIKAGDVLTLQWMYQTGTFAFKDATGNIVQQTIPTF
jgi:hypothetical protein